MNKAIDTRREKDDNLKPNTNQTQSTRYQSFVSFRFILFHFLVTSSLKTRIQTLEPKGFCLTQAKKNPIWMKRQQKKQSSQEYQKETTSATLSEREQSQTPPSQTQQK
jgi:hypothetical protein